MTQINAGNFEVDTSNPPNYGTFVDGGDSLTPLPLFLRTSNLIGPNDIHLYVTYTNQDDFTQETMDYTIIPGLTGASVTIPIRTNSGDTVKDVTDARVVAGTGNDLDAFIFLLDDETSTLSSGKFELMSEGLSHTPMVSGRSIQSEIFSTFNSTVTGSMNPMFSTSISRLEFDSNLMWLSSREIGASSMIIDALLRSEKFDWLDNLSGEQFYGKDLHLIGFLLESEVGAPVIGYVKDQNGAVITSDEEMRIYIRSTSAGEKSVFSVRNDGFFQLFLKPIGYDDVRLIKMFLAEPEKEDFDIAYRLFPEGTILDGNNPPSELQFFYIPIDQIVQEAKKRGIDLSKFIGF